jgi:Tol biopolymer transport system component
MQPLPVGEPRMLLPGGFDGANYLRDGRLVITQGPNLSVTDVKGSPRQLASVPGHAINPVVSPDGKLVRFTLGGDKGLFSIWEVNSDGTRLHELFHRWSDSVGEQVGNWTPDGKYFVFQVEHAGRWDLWALPERGNFLHRSATPLQLTNGPLSYEDPVVSPNGHQIFVVGSKKHGELVHYDVKSHQFVPYLSGISAVESRVSPDGKWVVYESYPDHTLWRCRPDGSERHQLTFPPMMAYYPEISPDSTKVAFTGTTPDSLVDVYVVPMAGEPPQKVVEWGHAPAWSPDGNSLAYATLVPGAHVFQQAGAWLEIHTIDLRTRQVTVLPSSDNQYGPWWPRPDLIVAESFDPYGGFEICDLKTKQWTRIGKGDQSYLNWAPSPDGKYLYALNSSPAGQKIERVRAEDLKFEDVASLGDLRMVNDNTLQQASLDFWIGVAADGSPTLTRDVGSDEIYALDVKWP